MGEDLALANGHVCNFWLCSCLPFDTAVIQGQPKASFRRCGTVFPRKWGRSCLSHPCACTASPPKGELQGKQIKPLKPDGAVRKLCGGPPGKRRACYHVLKMCHATLSTHASDQLGWGEDLSGFLVRQWASSARAQSRKLGTTVSTKKYITSSLFPNNLGDV